MYLLVVFVCGGLLGCRVMYLAVWYLCKFLYIFENSHSGSISILSTFFRLSIGVIPEVRERRFTLHKIYI